MCLDIENSVRCVRQQPDTETKTRHSFISSQIPSMRAKRKRYKNKYEGNKLKER